MKYYGWLKTTDKFVELHIGKSTASMLKKGGAVLYGPYDTQEELIKDMSELFKELGGTK